MFNFGAIGSTLKDFAGKLSKVRLDIETLRRERENIAFAPVPKSDILAALEMVATANAKKYQEYIGTKLAYLAATPGAFMDANSIIGHFRSLEFLPEPSLHAPVSRDVQLCGLIGPAGFMDLMEQQVGSLQLPDAGLPVQQRDKAISDIDKKIKALQDQELELLASAEKAGLHVS